MRVCRRGRGRRTSAGHGEGTGDQAPRAERVREQERVTLSPLRCELHLVPQS